MSQQHLSQESTGRFRSVESISTQIFDKFPELDKKGQETGEAVNASQESEASDIVSGCAGAANDASAADTQIELLWGAIVGVFGGGTIKALADVTRERQQLVETEKHRFEKVTRRDFDYRATPRRAHLPEGIEPLTGKPSNHTEDQMMRSIREVVNEQERERKELELENKRELSRSILPPLEPQATEIADVMPDVGMRVKPSLIRSAKLKLRRIFMKDFFLASSLSTWFALAAMVFIDPTLHTALFITSLLLLFVWNCISKSDSARHPK